MYPSPSLQSLDPLDQPLVLLTPVPASVIVVTTLVMFSPSVNAPVWVTGTHAANIAVAAVAYGILNCL